jgi:hypothetical protein
VHIEVVSIRLVVASRLLRLLLQSWWDLLSVLALGASWGYSRGLLSPFALTSGLGLDLASMAAFDLVYFCCPWFICAL